MVGRGPGFGPGTSERSWSLTLPRPSPNPQVAQQGQLVVDWQLWRQPLALTDNNQLGWKVALFLAGVILSGMLMMLRGDWLGSEAAQAVESRLSKRINRYELKLDRRLERMETTLKELAAQGKNK